MDKKKIKIIVFGLPPGHIGGMEYQSLKIAQNLSKYYNIELIARKHPKFDNSIKKNNFTITEFKCINNQKFVGISFFLKLLKYFIFKREYDLAIYIQTFPHGLIGLLNKKLFNKDYIIWTRHEREFKRLKRFRKIIYGLIYRNSFKVFVQSPNLKNDFDKEFNKVNCVFIPNGVEPRKKVEFNNSLKKLVFIGRLTKQKNVDLLVKIVNYNKKYSLTIYGDGPLKDELKLLSKNNKRIHFLGVQSRNKIINDLKKYSILILPSRSEGTPNVILEAMSVGMPVIATNVGGVKFLIHNNKNGILTRPTIINLERSIYKLLNNSTIYNKISKNAYNSSKNFYWESILKTLINNLN